MQDKKLTMKDLGLDPGKCLVIGEVAQAHDGSLGMAHAFIDSIAEAGAGAIKFQTHIAIAESTMEEPWRVRFSYQDETRFDYWKRMEFTPAQWEGLANHARDRGLLFISTPFSVAAVELLDQLGVPFWKVASGEMGNPELLEAIWLTRRPIVFSSGMSAISDLHSVTKETRNRKIPFAVLQCTSSYPCPPELWGLGEIEKIRDTFNCPVGLSDHSGTIYAGLAAATLGADIIEVHVAFHRGMFGPDVSSSIITDELASLVEGVEKIQIAANSHFDKTHNAEQAVALKTIFGRSWAPCRDLDAGTILQETDMTLKKPGTGIPYEDKADLIGKRLRVDKKATHIFTLDDVE